MTGAAQDGETAKVRVFAAVVLAWAGNWPLMKLAVDAVGPAWVAAWRFLIAAAMLVVIATGTRTLRTPTRSEWLIVLWVGALQMALFTFLTAMALTVLPAGRASVMAFATPLWVAPAAAVLLNERLGARGWAGVALGLAGLGWLAAESLVLGRAADVWRGVAMLLAASMCWAAVIVAVRRMARPGTGFALVPWQAALAAMPLTVAAYALEGPPAVRGDAAAIAIAIAIASMLYVGLIATAFAFWGTMWLATRISAVAMAVGLSIGFMGEVLTPHLVGGVGCVLLGSVLTLRKPVP